MTEDKTERVVIDVRRTRADETVLCMGHPEAKRWSRYVVTAETRYLGLSGVTTLYMCKPCLEELLVLADRLEVG